MSHWLKRLLLALVLFELGYLVLVNLALNLPLTQDLINRIKPDKVAVHWQRAWSWYPFRVHVRGIAVDGQSGSQQWQVDAAAGSASIWLPALLSKTVRLYAIEGRDVVYQQRPRARPGRGYAKVREFFPVIRNRDPDSPAVIAATSATASGGQPGKGWTIDLRDLHASGSHEVWIYQLRGRIAGGVRANLSYTTRGGAFSLGSGQLDLILQSLSVNGEPVIAEPGTVKGRVGFDPFVPSEHKGAAALAFLKADLELDLPVESLDFLDLYFERFAGMGIDGRGAVRGRLRYADGLFLPETGLTVAARELSVAALEHAAQGEGEIGLRVTRERPEVVQVGIRFGALRGVHRPSGDTLFSGEGLTVTSLGPARVLPANQVGPIVSEVALKLPSVVVGDIAAYQRYLPERWQLSLHRGRGELSAEATLTATRFDAELRLVSPQAAVGFRDYGFETGLDLGLQLRSEALGQASIDVSGSYLKLDGSVLGQDQRGESDEWRSSLAIERGLLSLDLPADDKQPGFKVMFNSLRQQGLKASLAQMSGEFEVGGQVSDLAWVGLLFDNPFHIGVSGSGTLQADLRLVAGSLAEGTTIRANAAQLGVHFLDYQVVGDGAVALNVTRGGRQPDMDLSMQVSDAVFKRNAEQQAFVEDVTLDLRAQGRNLGAKPGRGSPDPSVDLRLKIPQARVIDMAVYSQYFPAKFPLQVLGGEADLKADIRLTPGTADGYVRLTTEGLRMRLDQQQIDGELSADIRLAGGTPQDMAFDISGSTLLLDRVQVRGQTEGYTADDWRARISLREANTVWRKPLRLDMRADLEISDSRPVVAIFSNQRGKHGWLSKLLTIKDIQGEVDLKLDDQRLTINRTYADSDKIGIGAKGIISPDTRSGVFYARWRKLKGIVEVRDGERGFSIIGAKKKFDAYRAGQTQPLATGSKGSLEQLEVIQEGIGP